MRVTALARGGCSVYGSGWYDPHADEVIIPARDGETVALTIEYPAAPSGLTDTEHGVSCTAPVVSGNKATATISSIQDGGYVDIAATVSGATRIIRFRGQSQTETDQYE